MQQSSLWERQYLHLSLCAAHVAGCGDAAPVALCSTQGKLCWSCLLAAPARITCFQGDRQAAVKLAQRMYEAVVRLPSPPGTCLLRSSATDLAGHCL